MSLEVPQNLPMYWEVISDNDRQAYNYLRAAMAAPSYKNRRNRSIETFSETIESIKAYVVRNDSDDWKRSLVCGICWLNESSIAINTRQLRILLGKCKSSINGSLQMLGYGTVPNGAECQSSLINYFPFLKDSFSELRQWTVRQKIPLKKIEEPRQMASAFISPVPDVISTKNSSYDMFYGSIDPVYDNSYTVPELNMGISLFDDAMSLSLKTSAIDDVKVWKTNECNFDEHTSEFSGIDLSELM